MKAVVAAFNQEKALVGAFFVITNLRMELFEALVEDTEAAGGCSYTWSADYRLRVPSGLNMTEDMAAEFASQVQCPHLVVKAAQGPRYMSAEVYTRLVLQKVPSEAS